nr:hypothetical protein [Tanacetum cinerariifolium]
ISSGSTTTHSNISLSEYDSFIFEEFVDELTHIISPLEYDCFYFKDLPNPGELMSVLNSGIRESFSTTLVNLPIEDDHSPLLAYVVWIFVAYLAYPVILPYLQPFGNEDTIFDPGITINHFYSCEPVLSHRHGAFKKFNTHRKISSRDSVECKSSEIHSYEGNDFMKSFVSAVTGQMTYPVVILTLDSARSYVMQGASFTRGTISNIPIGGSISPEVVIVVAIIGVVVVVGGGVSSILKLSFMIIGFLRKIVFYYLLHQSMGYGNSFFQGNPPMKTSMSFSEFGTMFGHKSANSWNLLILSDSVDLFYSNMLGICIPPGQSITSQRVSLDLVFLLDTMEILEFKTSKDRYGDNRMSDSIGGLVFLVTKVGENRMSSGGIIDLTSDEDPTDEDGDTGMDDSTGVSTYLGGKISSEVKKFQESNSDNTGGTTVGEAIRACSGGMGNSLVASYACMTSIYGSSCKGEKTSMSKRYLVKSFEESREVFPSVAGK